MMALTVPNIPIKVCVASVSSLAGNCAGSLLQGMISFVHMLHELSGGISHI